MCGVFAEFERAMIRVLGGSRSSLGFRLVYDVAHNIAKLEDHDVGVDGAPLLFTRDRPQTGGAAAAGSWRRRAAAEHVAERDI